jgi:hypothetical protein
MPKTLRFAFVFASLFTVAAWDPASARGTGSARGQASVDILDRQEVVLPPPLPEVLVLEAGVDEFTFDAGDAICDVASGAPVSLGTTTVTCTLGDGEAYSFDVVMTDATAPELTLPSDITTLDHTVTFTASAIDNLDGPVNVACAPASGSDFPDGETAVRCVTQDSFANETADTFLVTVGPPVFHLSGDSSTEATGPGGTVVTYDANVGSGTIDCVPASGALFPVATTTVTCSATNAVGSSTAAFHVSVVDTTPPSLMVPGGITVNASSSNGAVVNYQTASTDIVSGDVVVLCSTPSGSIFPVGTTLVDCRATDAQNNTTTASFSVTVQ